MIPLKSINHPIKATSLLQQFNIYICIAFVMVITTGCIMIVKGKRL